VAEKKIFKFAHKEARRRAADFCLSAPDGWVARFSEPTRSLDQNAKLHAMLTDISRQLTYHGSQRSVEFWKGLFVSGWQIATGEKPEIVPGLEGEFINIRESTTTLTVRRMASLIEYIMAYGSSNGVVWSDDVISERTAA
jgi:hypothetical protein